MPVRVDVPGGKEAAGKANSPNTTVIRTGVVLEKGGGALGKILPIFQLYAGGPLGSGEQWLSWIHRDDLVGLIMVGCGRVAVVLCTHQREFTPQQPPPQSPP